MYSKFIKLILLGLLINPLIGSQNFLATPKKKLSKAQLKQKIGEQYEIYARQTAKIAEINALIQQSIFDQISRLISDENNSIFKLYSVNELNNYYENLKKATESNDKELSYLISSLNNIKSDFSVKSTIVQENNNKPLKS